MISIDWMIVSKEFEKMGKEAYVAGFKALSQTFMIGLRSSVRNLKSG
jgi:hypothetical protein